MSPRRTPLPETRVPTTDGIESTWRVFVAVPLPEPVVQLVGQLVRDLSSESWPGRWIAPETAHITLQFIGETSPERAELLRLALAAPIAKHTAFNLRTADLGVFPNQRRPRVIWLGLYGPAHRLEALQRDASAIIRGLDFDLDDHQFHPHITLGRLRNTRDQSARELPAAIQRRFAMETEAGRVSARDPLPVPVRELLLMRSLLSHRGARYETLARYPLAKLEPRR